MYRCRLAIIVATLSTCLPAQAQPQFPPAPAPLQGPPQIPPPPAPLPLQTPPAPAPLPPSSTWNNAQPYAPSTYPYPPQGPAQSTQYQAPPPIIVPDRLAPPPSPVETPPSPLPPDQAWITPSDNHRIWVTADYLFWWVKGAPLPQPLITAGSSSDTIPGALGQPNTRVLFGDRTVGFGPASGIRFGLGGWLDAQHLWALDADGFILERKQRQVLYGSDGNSDLAIAQPVINPATGESAYVTSYKGLIAGTIFASTSTQFGGWELNGMRNLVRNANLEFNVLAGFREVILRESLYVDSNIQQLQPNVLSFAGQSVNVGDQIYTTDGFRARTNFYGPQIGGKLSWTSNRFGVDLVGKIALGVSHESVSIDGWTSLYPAANNSITSIPGGLLAQSTNIGAYGRNVFAVAPEANLNLHYDLAPWARVNLGYTFMYLSRAVRPGLVVDRAVDPGLVPSSGAFGSGTVTGSPAFYFHDGGYWAQGLNLGLTLRF
jgi:hypothetical protein